MYRELPVIRAATRESGFSLFSFHLHLPIRITATYCYILHATIVRDFTCHSHPILYRCTVIPHTIVLYASYLIHVKHFFLIFYITSPLTNQPCFYIINLAPQNRFTHPEVSSMDKLTLTNNELEIMELLWTQGRPLSRTEIIELTPERSWSSKSIHIILNKLRQNLFPLYYPG